jgi:hypothetical protein
MKRIAARLGVSPSSVSLWTRDIQLSQAQIDRNLDRGAPGNSPSVSRRARVWAEKCRRRRVGFQQEGRLRARQRDPLHQAGCMLYWAEGSKKKNNLTFANSDLDMVRYFCHFLRVSLGVRPEQMTLRLNVYTGNGIPLREIEAHWLRALELPRSCLRGHTLDHTPTSSSGRKKNRLPYGVASIRVLRSTRLVQHIYGAIQEYAGFEEPRWLD